MPIYSLSNQQLEKRNIFVLLIGKSDDIPDLLFSIKNNSEVVIINPTTELFRTNKH